MLPKSWSNTNAVKSATSLTQGAVKTVKIESKYLLSYKSERRSWWLSIAISIAFQLFEKLLTSLKCKKQNNRLPNLFTLFIKVLSFIFETEQKIWAKNAKIPIYYHLLLISSSSQDFIGVFALLYLAPRNDEQHFFGLFVWSTLIPKTCSSSSFDRPEGESIVKSYEERKVISCKTVVLNSTKLWQRKQKDFVLHHFP